MWFKSTAAFDAGCNGQFAASLQAARSGALDAWAETPTGTLALVIVLDQLSRNIHRGTPAAYAADEQARRIALTAMARGFDQRLGPIERTFFYMPLMHSECAADQDAAAPLFEVLRDAYAGVDSSIKAPHRHRDVIRRFGRFPHRNAILGRVSTPEEIAYLAEPGARF